MDPALLARVEKLLLNGSTAARKKLCEEEFIFFCMYYFSEYMKRKCAPFHFDFAADCKAMAKNELSEVAWIAYAESAKTSFAKMYLTWLICYKKKNFIVYDSYELDNSEAALYDVTNWLRINKKIVRDFGRLYKRSRRKNAFQSSEEQEDKVKRLGNFITENNIKVVAVTTQMSPRGFLFNTSRPDQYIVDDIENNKTKDSYPTIKKIKDHVNELKRGMAPNAAVLYLGNFITEEGAISYIMENVKNNPKGRLRFIPVVQNNKISWPDKYVFTDAEAAKLNEGIEDPLKWKISLETKRIFLTNRVYETEMMNNPSHSGDLVFDRERIDLLIKKARAHIADKAGLKIWAEYNPAHRYAIGADTAKGVGRDSCASAVIDCSTIPNRIVGTYANNKIAPDIFGNELARQGDIFGTCLLGPEKNNTGYATITKLKQIYPTEKIFVPLRTEKVKEKLDEDYGWETNGATKPEMIYSLKSAVEDGLLEIFDVNLLEEMRYYRLRDLQIYKPVEGMTRHFDLLTATAIAWAIRHHARISSKSRKTFTQTPHVPTSEFGG